VTTPAATGQRDTAKIFVVTLGVLLAAAAVAVAIWSVTSDGRPAAVRGHVVIVETGNPKELRVTLDVEKAPLASAECDISAFDAKGTSVGRLVGVVVGPSSRNERVMRLTVSVPTPLGAGRSAQVATCRVTRTR
jgi:hypothetical protein